MRKYYVQFKDPLKGMKYVDCGNVSNMIYLDLKTLRGAIRRAKKDTRAKYGFRIYIGYPDSDTGEVSLVYIGSLNEIGI